MNYHLEHKELANALYLALAEDTFYRVLEDALEGDKQHRKQAMMAYMDYSIIESQKFGECFIPKRQNYGVSIWSKPVEKNISDDKTEAKKLFIMQYMGEKAYQVYHEICTVMANNAKPLNLSKDWYLSIIGILPEFQGQGLGPGLVQRVLDKTDQLGVASYLETFTPRNMAFYFRLGYESLGAFKIPHSDQEYWLMRRQPVS